MRPKTAAFALGKHGYSVRALKPDYEELRKAGFKNAENKAVEKPAKQDAPAAQPESVR